QSLLAHCLISNPISAKMAFEGRSVESVIQLASVPYSSINDNKVKITESDLKDKYDEMKEQFKQFVESRDIKYVDYKVVASPTDRAALNKEISGAANQLKNGADVAQTVRKASSLINYL
ncbi:MAG TPA: peptidylprolyl isomerase, partial [Xylanibacter oryzae]|nr:peptidylprolyl isomerase [Xylanibacter oryzae]